MEESIQKTTSEPDIYRNCRDIREAFMIREYEIKIEKQKKLLLNETCKLEDETRKREEEKRMKEETMKRYEKEESKRLKAEEKCKELEAKLRVLLTQSM